MTFGIGHEADLQTMFGKVTDRRAGTPQEHRCYQLSPRPVGPSHSKRPVSLPGITRLRK